MVKIRVKKKQFHTRILISDKNLNMAKISIFSPEFSFFTKFGFFTKISTFDTISIIDQNVDFEPKNIFGPN